MIFLSVTFDDSYPFVVILDGRSPVGHPHSWAAGHALFYCILTKLLGVRLVKIYVNVSMNSISSKQATKV